MTGKDIQLINEAYGKQVKSRFACPKCKKDCKTADALKMHKTQCGAVKENVETLEGSGGSAKDVLFAAEALKNQLDRFKQFVPQNLTPDQYSQYHNQLFRMFQQVKHWIENFH